MKLIINKKGEGTKMLLVLIITLIVNVIFFTGMFYFVERSGSTPSIYEHFYAKKLALIIDNSNPDTIVSLNINDLNQFFGENKLNINNVFIIQNNKVIVKLNNNPGYSFDYFSDYDVEISSHKDPETQDLFVDILIKERKNV